MNDKLAKLMFVLLVLALAFCVVVLWVESKQAGPAGVKHEMTNLVAGLEYYHAIFGSFPTGNNAQVTGALRGENPRKQTIDTIGPRRMFRWNELSDIWDTPYRFNFSSNSTITVSSAGKNGLFGDDDDLVVSVSLNDTNFPFVEDLSQLTNTAPQK